jgi:hypothetical protein
VADKQSQKRGLEKKKKKKKNIGDIKFMKWQAE